MRKLKLGAGKLREKVEIETRSISVSAGEQIPSYSSEGTFRASVAPVRSQEASGELDSVREVCNFTFRRHSITEAIAPGDRFTWRTLKFHVTGGPHLGDLQFVTIVAERQDPNAVD